MTLARLLVPALVVILAADSLNAQAPPVAFTPSNGFGGRSEGNGTGRLFGGRPRAFHVESFGFDRGDGSFQLDQTVTFRGKPPRDRTWVITPVGGDRYTATLSDAAGGVTGRTDGNLLFLRYRMAGPLVVHQTLELGPDGTTIDNRGRVTVLGLPVGRLHETIVRKD